MANKFFILTIVVAEDESVEASMVGRLSKRGALRCLEMIEKIVEKLKAAYVKGQESEGCKRVSK